MISQAGACEWSPESGGIWRLSPIGSWIQFPNNGTDENEGSGHLKLALEWIGIWRNVQESNKLAPYRI